MQYHGMARRNPNTLFAFFLVFSGAFSRFPLYLLLRCAPQKDAAALGAMGFVYIFLFLGKIKVQ